MAETTPNPYKVTETREMTDSEYDDAKNAESAMIAKCPNPLGPIPKWVRERWEGDKPYPTVSFAQREAKKGEEATTNRRAKQELSKNCPDFEKSADHEQVYIDRSGGVYGLRTRNTADAIFTSRDAAVSYVRMLGYIRTPVLNTDVRIAYEREPNA